MMMYVVLNFPTLFRLPIHRSVLRRRELRVAVP